MSRTIPGGMQNLGSWGRSLALAAVVFTLALAPGESAAQSAREFLEEGLSLLRARDYEAALEKFEAAGEADPAPRIFVFQGVALNRLGRHREALQRLATADKAGVVLPLLDFELGWSAVNLGLWRVAAQRLERFEEAKPGGAKTVEFLGRAYLGLGRLDEAEAQLREALRRDPDVKPTVLYYLAVVEQARGDSAAAQEELQTLIEIAPESPLAVSLRDTLAFLARVEKPWSVVVSAGGGYNSNVIALGDGIALPVDISSKDAGFGRATLDATYAWRLTEADVVTVGYGLQADIYQRSLSGFDLIDQNVFADLRHLMRRNLSLGLRLSDQFTLLGGDKIRNQVAIRPSLAYRVTDRAVAELAYGFGVGDYFFTTPAVQDRDNNSHALSLTGYFAVPGTELRARLGFFFVRNEADGADFDLDTHGLTAALSGPVVRQITGEVLYTRTFDRYDNPNSLAGPLGFAFTRKDEVDRVTVRLFHPFRERSHLFVRYDFTNDDSNIAFFNFDQHVVSGGLVLRF